MPERAEGDNSMLAFVLALAVVSSAVAGEEDLQAQLKATKRIYVDRLGGGEVAGQIRDMIISSLQRSGRFVITENPDRADVHMRGSAEDLVFTDVFQSSEGVGGRAGVNVGTGAPNSRDRRNFGASAGVNDNESVRIQERKHEAVASVRLVNRDGDVLWSTTKESQGAKFRGSSADVAEKITRQLLDDLERLGAAPKDPRTGGR
jgi:hypothetical protein